MSCWTMSRCIVADFLAPALNSCETVCCEKSCRSCIKSPIILFSYGNSHDVIVHGENEACESDWFVRKRVECLMENERFRRTLFFANGPDRHPDNISTFSTCRTMMDVSSYRIRPPDSPGGLPNWNNRRQLSTASNYIKRRMDRCARLLRI